MLGRWLPDGLPPRYAEQEIREAQHTSILAETVGSGAKTRLCDSVCAAASESRPFICEVGTVTAAPGRG